MKFNSMNKRKGEERKREVGREEEEMSLSAEMVTGTLQSHPLHSPRKGNEAAHVGKFNILRAFVNEKY